MAADAVPQKICALIVEVSLAACLWGENITQNSSPRLSRPANDEDMGFAFHRKTKPGPHLLLDRHTGKSACILF